MMFEIKWEESLSKFMSLPGCLVWSLMEARMGVLGSGSSVAWLQSCPNHLPSSLLATPGQELVMEFLVPCCLQGCRGRAGQRAWLSIPAGGAGRALDPIAVSLTRASLLRVSLFA